MSNPTHNSDDNDPAGIPEALRRDARRIEEAPFDMALQRETMARIRAGMDVGPPRHWFGLTPALAMSSVGLVGLVAAVLFIAFLFKASPHRETGSIAEVAALPQGAPRASVLSYERAMAQGDEAFSAALDRDAQALLPASAKLPDGLP
jgi:hypothetical protein